MTFWDVRRMPARQRAHLAAVVQRQRSFELPRMEHWNYDPCGVHGSLTPGCVQCGVEPRRHQRAGIAWMYLVMRGLLADPTGSGKTVHVAGVLALMLETGELSEAARAVIVCRSAAVAQWRDELARMVPSLRVMTAVGTPAQRRARYADPWEVAVISPSMLAGAGKRRGADGDLAKLRTVPLSVVVYDDTDVMRNPSNRQAYAIKKLCERPARAYALHATPLQKRVTELYSFLEPLGGRDILGTLSQFKRHYIKQGATYFHQVGMVCPRGHLTPPPDRRCTWRPEGVAQPCGEPAHPDPAHRKVLRKVAVEKGILPERVDEFRKAIAPLVLRRRVQDMDDVSLPAVQLSHVWLDPTAAQQRRYGEIRSGVLRMLREAGEEVTRPQAAGQYLRAWQVCSGLAALDGRDSAGASIKLDWIMERLAGDLEGEKVVVFINFTPNIEALSGRLRKEGIEHVVIWGLENSTALRAERLRKFRDDPQCRVLLGTTAIEASLNLQAARHLILSDVIMNSKRIEQLIGRVRRNGSAYETVYAHMLLTRGTMEEGFLPLLGSESALSDTVWNETSDLFGSLTPRQMLELVAKGKVAV